MSDIRLLHSTGNQKVDQILRGVVGVYELSFPGRICGYYLGGSYAEGRATPTSDLDLCVMFKDTFYGEEEDKARQLLLQLKLFDPIVSKI